MASKKGGLIDLGNVKALKGALLSWAWTLPRAGGGLPGLPLLEIKKLGK